ACCRKSEPVNPKANPREIHPGRVMGSSNPHFRPSKGLKLPSAPQIHPLDSVKTQLFNQPSVRTLNHAHPRCNPFPVKGLQPPSLLHQYRENFNPCDANRMESEAVANAMSSRAIPAVVAPAPGPLAWLKQVNR